MNKHTGFMIVHKSRWMKWLKPVARVLIKTFDNTIVNNETWPSFQTVTPYQVYKINVAEAELLQHEWLYEVVKLDNLPMVEDSPVYNVMCCREV